MEHKNNKALFGTGMISAAISTLGFPAFAFAAGESSSTGIATILPNVEETVPMLIAFILLWIILAKYGWPAFSNVIKKRNETITNSLKQAEESRQESERVLAEYKKELADARSEAAEIVAEAKKTGEATRAQITAQAQKESEEMIKKAKAAIEQEKRNAIEELQGSVADISCDVASKLIDQDLSDDEHRKIIERYVKEAGSFHAN